MGWFGPQSGDCSCCETPGPCQCTDGIGGSIIARKSLQAVVSGSVTTGASGFCVGGAGPGCVDPTGTYPVACGDTLETWIHGASCNHDGSIFPLNTPHRISMRIVHSFGGVSSGSAFPVDIYDAVTSNGLIAIETHDQYFFDWLSTGTAYWDTWGIGRRESQAYIIGPTIGDECPSFSSGASSSYFSGAATVSKTCDITGLTITLSAV